MGLPFKSHFKLFILKVAVWLRGYASVPSYHPSTECFGSNTVKSSIFFIFFLFFFFFFFFIKFLEIGGEGGGGGGGGGQVVFFSISNAAP